LPKLIEKLLKKRDNKKYIFKIFKLYQKIKKGKVNN